MQAVRTLLLCLTRRAGAALEGDRTALTMESFPNVQRNDRPPATPAKTAWEKGAEAGCHNAKRAPPLLEVPVISKGYSRL